MPKNKTKCAAEVCFNCFWLVQGASPLGEKWRPGFYCHHPERRTLANWSRRDPISPMDPVPKWCHGFCDHWPDPYPNWNEIQKENV